MIPFNKPYSTGKELEYISDAIKRCKLSGNGYYTQKCQEFFEKNYDIRKCLLTTSCTDALEMCAILTDIKAGDEVIVPSFTFVSSAVAFVRCGAKIVFCDSQENDPNIDPQKIESLITEKTKAIVAVHYAGVSCDMDAIMKIAATFNLIVIEDAAQAIDSYYISPVSGIKKALGSIGHLSAFSFHETKNIICGEGGMLGINDERFINRAEIIWEKGTNRAEFFRGEVNKYGWKDIGSSFLPSEINAAFLFSQLENLEIIQSKRIRLKNYYTELFQKIAVEYDFNLQFLPSCSTENGHMFYVVFNSLEDRSKYISKLKGKNIMAVFHYQSLHKSDYCTSFEIPSELPVADKFSDCLVRFPLYYELDTKDIDYIFKCFCE